MRWTCVRRWTRTTPGARRNRCRPRQPPHNAWPLHSRKYAAATAVRRLGRRRHGGIARARRAHRLGFLLGVLRELRSHLLFSVEVVNSPRGECARWQLCAHIGGARPIEVGEQRSAGIIGDRCNRTVRRSKPEPVQSERCRILSPHIQRKFLRPRPTPQIS